jgi:hypothetical protein
MKQTVEYVRICDPPASLYLLSSGITGVHTRPGFHFPFNEEMGGQVLVTHTCNPGTWEAQIGRIVTEGQQCERPHLQNNQNKMDWRCGSSKRVADLQAHSREFKP